MTTIRASSLPIVTACAASLDVETPIDSSDESAMLGSAVHAWLADAIKGKLRDVGSVAGFYGVDADQLEKLIGVAWSAWKRYRDDYPEAQVEAFLTHDDDELTLTGHLDVLSVLGKQARIADWKSGWGDTDHTAQVKGYAFLVVSRFPEVQRVHTRVIGIRHGTADAAYWERDDLFDWFDSLKQHIKHRSTFRPGEHCTYCPRRLTCPGYAALTIQARRLIDSVEEDDSLSVMTPKLVGEIHVAERMLSKRCEAIHEWVVTQVASNGNRLDIGNGMALELNDCEKRTIDPAKGTPILRDVGISEEEINDASSTSKTKMEAAMKAIAGKGRGAAAVRNLNERLEVAGAFRVTTFEKLECKRNGNTTNAITTDSGTTADA